MGGGVSMAEIFRLPLRQGTRVRVNAPKLPDDCREGVIWQHKPKNGGYLIQHDKSPFSDGLCVGECLFGWSYREVERLPRVDNNVDNVADLRSEQQWSHKVTKTQSLADRTRINKRN